jgi:hypothetical protein
MKRSLAVIVPVGLAWTLSLAALSGCGNGVKATDTARVSAAAMPTATMPPEALAKAAQPAWSPSPPAPGEVVYPGVGVRYTPTSEPASVTGAQARAVAETAPYASVESGQPRVQLARVTDDDFPPGSRPTLHHDEKALAWVVTYTNTRPQNFGGAYSTSPPGCDLVVIVDATSAAILAGFQSCSAR